MGMTLRQEILDPPDAPEEDPFHHGWRYVRQIQPDGTVDFDQVPLTLEDVLHPQVEDFIAHSSEHANARRYLADVSRAQVKHDPSAVVLSDTRIAWDRGRVRPMGPDVAVIFGVRAIKNWATFHCTREGTRPALVIEVTSPETSHLDLDRKLKLYARAEIPLYVIVDYDVERHKPPYERDWTPPPPSILAYRLGPHGYEPIAPDERGWIWMEPVHLWISIQDGHVQCYDEEGSPVGDYAAISAALKEARIRLEQTQRAREESERAREESERARAQERAARLEAEERMAALEARLKELEKPASSRASKRRRRPST